MTKASGATYVAMYPSPCQHTYERRRFPNRTDLESGDELAEGDNEKVEVEEELELLVKDEGQEGDDGVFLIADDIGWIWRFVGWAMCQLVRENTYRQVAAG